MEELLSHQNEKLERKSEESVQDKNELERLRDLLEIADSKLNTLNEKVHGERQINQLELDRISKKQKNDETKLKEEHELEIKSLLKRLEDSKQILQSTSSELRWDSRLKNKTKLK